MYNSSQYNNLNQNDNRYDPFIALYDEDAEIYKDNGKFYSKPKLGKVKFYLEFPDYTPQNNNYNTNAPTRGTAVHRGTPATRDDSAKRGNVVYNNVNQDIYQQPSTVSDYSDNAYQVVISG